MCGLYTHYLLGLQKAVVIGHALVCQSLSLPFAFSGTCHSSFSLTRQFFVTFGPESWPLSTAVEGYHRRLTCEAEN